MNVGWACTAEEATICYNPPERFILEMDKTSKGLGYLSCPAIRDYFQSTFYITSPFSLQLSCTIISSGLVIRPVYPFTSLSEAKVHEFIKVESESSWRNKDVVVLQMPSPYVFFADEQVILKQEPAQLITPSSHSWRLIPGQFNIYDWQRPLNFSVEWYPAAGDFILRVGEPIYFMTFHSPDGLSAGPVNLINSEITPDILRQMKQSQGITSLRRGVKPLLKLSGQLRKERKLIRE